MRKLVLWALVTAAVALAWTPAEAKQCIWNKGGFVLRIDWFAPEAISTNLAADGFQEFSFSDQPAQTDVIWSGNGRCINRGSVQYAAVLSICGSNFKARVVQYPDVWPVDSRIDCSIYAVVSPGVTRWLDVWGALWQPETGEGGPL